MLAVHWTPVNNTKAILRNGIRKSKKGLFCFPLTGHPLLDKWWVNFFNQCGARHRKKYNGIVFRIIEADLPAYFGNWIAATSKQDFKKDITDLKELGYRYRDLIMWRLGEEIANAGNLNVGITDYSTLDILYTELANREINQKPEALTKKLKSLDFMTFALEDYQIVLSHSIPADRIIKVIPQGNEFGRVLRQKRKYGL